MLDNMSVFHRHVVSPLKENPSGGLRKLQLLLRSICLRRPRETLRLPEPKTSYKYLHLDAAEVEKYNATLGNFFEMMDKAATSGDIRSRKAFNIVFQALNRLRLLCNRGTIKTLESTEVGQSGSDDTLIQLQEVDRAFCHYCSSDITSIGISENAAGSAYLTDCLRLVCVECFGEYEDLCKQARRGKEFLCPLCQNAVSISSLRNSSSKGCKRQPREGGAVYPVISGGHSSKLAALSQDIEDHMDCTKRSAHSL